MAINQRPACLMIKIAADIAFFTMITRDPALGFGAAVRTLLLSCQLTLESLEVAVGLAQVVLLVGRKVETLLACLCWNGDATVDPDGVLFQKLTRSPL